jgi:hypothetical protein
MKSPINQGIDLPRQFPYKRRMIRLCCFSIVFLAANQFVRTPAFADLSCTPSTHPYARGYCQIARGRHGQWVRGSATLSKNALVIKLGLETDSTFFGIAGSVAVTIHDKDGTALASYKSATCAIAGKGKAHARIGDFTTQKGGISTDVAKKAAWLEVTPYVLQDNLPRPVGIRDWTIFVPIFSIPL